MREDCDNRCPACGRLCDGHHARAGPEVGKCGHPGPRKNSPRHFFTKPMEPVRHA